MGRAHSNVIEGIWAPLKNGIKGVYHSVSTVHLQSYLNGHVYRYNHRSDDVPMLETMLAQVEMD